MSTCLHEAGNRREWAEKEAEHGLGPISKKSKSKVGLLDHYEHTFVKVER